MPLRAVDTAWNNYVAAEQDRIRDVMMARVRELIAELQLLSEAERRFWSWQIAREAVDGNLTTPIRFPLFREVLFPSLIYGIQSEAPGCARWLAGFSQLLYKSQDCSDQLAPHLRTEIGLLREALRIDAKDTVARSRLIACIQWQLEYSLHELPARVLFGQNGATIEECRELREELAEFESLVIAHGTGAEHADLIAECAHHFGAYPAYLARQSEFRSYEEFLLKYEQI